MSALAKQYRCSVQFTDRLVLLLAPNEPNQSAKNSALATAVELHNLELIESLLGQGAEIRGVPFLDVLLRWQPTIIRLFLDGGADAIPGLPFTEAFAASVRTALRPFMEYKEARPELADDLQDQIDRALRHFCEKATSTGQPTFVGRRERKKRRLKAH